ncbi:MAG: hypothetical protein HQ574_06370 [Chloroflexi bacterium]|nr:hypothetical protein [Chloroflexota bacterium]
MSKIQNPTRINGFSPRLLFIPVLLIILSLACNLPVMANKSSQQDQPGFIETRVVETMVALEGDQAPGGENDSGQDSEVVPPSDTPAPVITDTPTMTPTVTNTPTPEVAMIYASANTNCRTGQGTYFPWVVTLNQGESSEAVGIDTSGEYWYIRRPDQPSSFCWLWGKYATPSGPYESLPVYTPIPTPTPGFDFKVTYLETIQCGAFWGLQFQIDNIGSFTLESWKSTAVDHTGGLANNPNEQDKFFSSTGCSSTATQYDLTPGEGSYVNAVFVGNPTGHDITVKIRICTEDGLAGDCLKKEINLKP